MSRPASDTDLAARARRTSWQALRGLLPSSMQQALAFVRSVWQRWFLWLLLAVLVMALLVTVVWLAGRHEAEQVQIALDRDTADAAADLRSGLQRNAQSLHALQAAGLDSERWTSDVTPLMRGHRE